MTRAIIQDTNLQQKRGDRKGLKAFFNKSLGVEKTPARGRGDATKRYNYANIDVVIMERLGVFRESFCRNYFVLVWFLYNVIPIIYILISSMACEYYFEYLSRYLQGNFSKTASIRKNDFEIQLDWFCWVCLMAFHSTVWVGSQLGTPVGRRLIFKAPKEDSCICYHYYYYYHCHTPVIPTMKFFLTQ